MFSALWLQIYEWVIGQILNVYHIMFEDLWRNNEINIECVSHYFWGFITCSWKNNEIDIECVVFYDHGFMKE